MANRFDTRNKKPAMLDLTSKRKVMMEFSQIKDNMNAIKQGHIPASSMVKLPDALKDFVASDIEAGSHVDPTTRHETA
jgi:hypothetical protein